MSRSVVREDRSPLRRPTNVSLDAAMVEAAKELDINLSRACEVGLAKEISDERNRRWREDNREANEAYTEYLAKHGLPLARYRMF